MRACIFDLDGTLLDSTGMWARIDVEFLERRGLAAPDDYVDAVASLSFPEAAAYTKQRFALPESAEALMAEWNDMCADFYANRVEMKPGAREYLSVLREKGVRLAVATSLPEALYRPALRRHGIEDWFAVTCSADEVGCGKTRPDLFLLAAERLGAEPGECTVFEDIPEAVRSAKSIGMRVYGVYDEASSAYWEEIRRTADGALCSFADAPMDFEDGT